MIFILLITFLLIINDILKKRMDSPTFVFNTITFITLFLYSFQLSLLQHQLSDSLVLILLTSIFVFNITSFCVNNTPIIKIKKKPRKFSKYISFFNIYKLLKKVIILLFIIQIVYSRGVPLIWIFTNKSLNYFNFGISSLTGMFNGLLICLAVYCLYFKNKDAILYLAISVLMLNRQVLLAIIIEYVLLLIIRKKVNLSKIFKIIIITIIIFGALGNIRTGNETFERVFESKENFKKIPTTIKWVYAYTTFSITNIDNLVTQDRKGQFNYGISTLKGFLPTIVLDKAEIEEKYNPIYLEKINFNVSTYMKELYLDFGVIGIILFNLIISIFSCRLYRKSKLKKSFMNNLMYAVCLHNIIMLYFTNMFIYLPVIVQFIFVPIVFKNIDEKRLNYE